MGKGRARRAMVRAVMGLARAAVSDGSAACIGRCAGTVGTRRRPTARRKTLHSRTAVNFRHAKVIDISNFLNLAQLLLRFWRDFNADLTAIFVQESGLCAAPWGVGIIMNASIDAIRL
jgi:hypothetical protein